MEGEFVLVEVRVRVYAPTTTTDEVGESLCDRLEDLGWFLEGATQSYVAYLTSSLTSSEEPPLRVEATT